MEQSPRQEADILSASQEISQLLRNSNVYCIINENLLSHCNIAVVGLVETSKAEAFMDRIRWLRCFIGR
jgi:hypothetical protein